MTDAVLHTNGQADGDASENPSSNPTFQSVIDQRYSRRAALFGGGAATAAMLGLAACDSSDSAPIPAIVTNVSAGSAQSVPAGRVVTLMGMASTNPGINLATSWSQVSGPPVTLTTVNSTTSTFLSPAVGAGTPLVFRFSATNGTTTSTADATVTVTPAELGFAAVSKNRDDLVTIPAGFALSTLYRLGDPLNASTPAYANDGTDTNFAARAGDHHDGIYYYGLAATGTGRDDNNSTRGVLVMNHENITQEYLHPNGPTGTGAGESRPEGEALKEIEAHGVSSVEVVRNGPSWSYVQNSPLNGRITPNTPVVFTGPVRGNPQLRTRFSADGTQGRGTVNNCANGFSLWGTNLTCEENWAFYFRRDAGDNTNRTAKDVTSLNRYGIREGNSGNYGWTTVTPADPANTTFARWNITANPAAPADGSGDFRNEAFHFGWTVETDPYNPNATPRKRTALGRIAREGAWPSNFVVGQKPVFYMGDDSRGEYIYKFVSAQPWVAADAQQADRLAVGDKYLDAGTLYVARFDATGSGVWLPLVFGQGPLTAANPVFPFADQSDVLIHTRLAADAVGATKMDRPEWAAVNTQNGEVYFTLTNNNATLRPLAGTDAANPRHYNDPKGTTNQRGNPNGHIIRMREAADNPESVSFTWDVYLFGAGADLDPANINLSGLNADNDFSSPDGLWFSRPTNVGGQVKPLLWIQTDDGAYTDVTNCMMLAALPGITGDGAARTITNTAADGTTAQQPTFVGAAPGMTLRRFLVGPKESEITGIDSTPDGQTIFVNIQHPGEGIGAGFPATFTSNWPASQSNPAAVSRPRSATIAITKTDGGIVGL